ncbi:MAG: branched-chain-amino-acid transaminase [Fimbriimonadaceae bacterium]|jgi:branched-chain amino acid aminotransferase|nr:branched-chain-amino-acid transaminase [Fimbriimonadaceae bacterium]
MTKLVWLNGVVSPLESATTSVADHAHLYGDGLFEGIRIYSGKVFKLDEHLDRLYHGCRYMNFAMEISKSELKEIILQTASQAEAVDGYIRLNVSRGSGLGLDPKAVKTAPNVMVMISTLALYGAEAYETGLDVITTSFRTIPADSLDQRLKCIGRYATHILAKAEANRAGAGEGLMLNHQGLVAECTGDNIFLVKDGVIKTPHASCGLLQGITRDTVIEIARRNGLVVEETLLTRYDLLEADETFLTGTAAEVIPMVTLDQRLIGDGRPGRLTKKIIDWYHEETLKGTPIPAYASNH